MAADGLTIGDRANDGSLNALELTITHFDSGLKFLGTATNSLISGLTITANKSGIELNGGSLAGTTIAGNIFSASRLGGNAMVLENTTGLTVGGSAAGTGNTLTAARGNALYAAGFMTGTGFYKNTLTASTNGALLNSVKNFLFGVANNAALGNIVQYNKVERRPQATRRPAPTLNRFRYERPSFRPWRCSQLSCRCGTFPPAASALKIAPLKNDWPRPFRLIAGSTSELSSAVKLATISPSPL